MVMGRAKRRGLGPLVFSPDISENVVIACSRCGRSDFLRSCRRVGWLADGEGLPICDKCLADPDEDKGCR